MQGVRLLIPSPTRARSIFGASFISPMPVVGMVTNVLSVIPRRLLRHRLAQGHRVHQDDPEIKHVSLAGKQDPALARVALSSMKQPLLLQQQKQRQKQRRRLKRKQRQRPSPSPAPQLRKPRSPILSRPRLRFVCAVRGIHPHQLFGRGPRTLRMTSRNALLLTVMWTLIVQPMMKHLGRHRRPNCRNIGKFRVSIHQAAKILQGQRSSSGQGRRDVNGEWR